MTELFAEVAVFGSALDKTLHYVIAADLAGAVRPGVRVAVPLGKRKATGLVISVDAVAPPLPEGVALRSILHLIDEPPLPGELLNLCEWISSYYFYPPGEVLETVFPPKGREAAVAAPKTRLVALAENVETEPENLPRKAREIFLLLKSSGGSLPARDLRKACGNFDYWLRKLVRSQILRTEEREEPVGPRRAQTVAPGEAFELTGDQKTALDTLLSGVEHPRFVPSVLYGVTGSGKTEIYLRLVEKASQLGRGSLFLVPEIALGTQLEAIFGQRFGSRLAVWHSGLSDKERRRQWSDILTGKTGVVLGARSAVLTPVKDLGLIIVDEEHDPSYKQEDRLRYNARDVALMRGKMLGIPVVLGSATPSLQTVHRLREKAYGCVRLPSRVWNRPQPEFEVVDMRREGARASIFSARLRDAIEGALAEGRQALLFLNRRGYAKYYLCNTCGHVLQCVSCSLTLTYHKKEDCLRCHYCGWEMPLPQRCPACGHAALFSHGFGTERVEREARRLFPDARLVRVDRDTTNSYRKLSEALHAVRSGQADILLGTQMIAKGHDFPNLTLVGVINADAGLQVPDFRAGENLVQLLLQVAGRAGRGVEPGRVVLQTYNPDHYSINAVVRLDYDGFCEKELGSRKILQYPPFTRLLKFLVTARSEDAAREGARALAALCREKAALLRDSGRQTAVLGPSPAAHVKLKNRFRWHVFIKTWSSADMQSFAECVLDSVKGETDIRDVRITVDRDPANEI